MKLLILKIKNCILSFIKELKRIRWYSLEKNSKNLIWVIIFIFCITIFLYFTTMGFIFLWNILGAGLNA